MDAKTRKWLTAGILLVTALVLIAGTVLIASIFFVPAITFRFDAFEDRGALAPFLGSGREFESNGARIYYTGISSVGPPITAEMPGMHEMTPGMMACVTCHGENGEGGVVRMMMMQRFEAPNIQFDALTEEGHGDEHEEHLPYDETSLARAIVEGIDPSGEPLDWRMPRWNMTEEQVQDLIAFLKTLE